MSDNPAFVMSFLLLLAVGGMLSLCGAFMAFSDEEMGNPHVPRSQRTPQPRKDCDRKIGLWMLGIGLAMCVPPLAKAWLLVVLS